MPIKRTAPLSLALDGVAVADLGDDARGQAGGGQRWPRIGKRNRRRWDHVEGLVRLRIQSGIAVPAAVGAVAAVDGDGLGQIFAPVGVAVVLGAGAVIDTRAEVDPHRPWRRGRLLGAGGDGRAEGEYNGEAEGSEHAGTYNQHPFVPPRAWVNLQFAEPHLLSLRGGPEGADEAISDWHTTHERDEGSSERGRKRGRMNVRVRMPTQDSLPSFLGFRVSLVPFATSLPPCRAAKLQSIRLQPRTRRRTACAPGPGEPDTRRA